jgi:C-terminal processing protease CtpA/Prc
VFAVARRLAVLLALLPLTSFAASDAKAPPQKNEPVQMRPYKVTGKRTDGFGLSYGMKYLLWGPLDDALFEDVESGSLPAKVGIKSGDQIVSIDGIPVKGMKRKDFEQRLLRNTAQMVLEIQTPKSKEVRKVELRFPPGFWEK